MQVQSLSFHLSISVIFLVFILNQLFLNFNFGYFENYLLRFEIVIVVILLIFNLRIPSYFSFIYS